MPHTQAGIFHVNPIFHATLVAWNMGLTRKMPCAADMITGLFDVHPGAGEVSAAKCRKKCEMCGDE